MSDAPARGLVCEGRSMFESLSFDEAVRAGEAAVGWLDWEVDPGDKEIAEAVLEAIEYRLLLAKITLLQTARNRLENQRDDLLEIVARVRELSSDDGVFGVDGFEGLVRALRSVLEGPGKDD